MPKTAGSLFDGLWAKAFSYFSHKVVWHHYTLLPSFVLAVIVLLARLYPSRRVGIHTLRSEVQCYALDCGEGQ